MPRREAELQFESPYDVQLQGVLTFATFDAAERCLGRLEKLRQGYDSAGDKKGVEYCRRLALLGRRRAELIGHNMRVAAYRRLQKIEIATWFRVWLETPALFEDWLRLRKGSAEFRRLAEADPAASGAGKAK